jgi:hypothetical protein
MQQLVLLMQQLVLLMQQLVLLMLGTGRVQLPSILLQASRHCTLPAGLFRQLFSPSPGGTSTQLLRESVPGFWHKQLAASGF